MLLHVFDGVLAPSTSKYLHAASSLGELGDELHTVYDRRQGPPKTAIESCLQSVLTALDDNSPFVEYWWRDTWEHVEAHEDVDEYLFEKTKDRRYPTNAHVLYLEVGKAVRGPTCVWQRADDAAGAAGRSDFGALSTVPARSGRLLRFDGELMHAVPKPTLRWLPTSARTGGMPRKKAEDLVRSVVLFNTWDEAPLDVGQSDGSADPAAVIGRLAAEFSSPKIEAMVQLMETADTECQAREKWTAVEPRSPSAAEPAAAPVPMKIALLGEADRRAQEEEAVRMDAPEGLSEALQEEEAVVCW